MNYHNRALELAPNDPVVLNNVRGWEACVVDVSMYKLSVVAGGMDSVHIGVLR